MSKLQDAAQAAAEEEVTKHPELAAQLDEVAATAAEFVFAAKRQIKRHPELYSQASSASTSSSTSADSVPSVFVEYGELMKRITSLEEEVHKKDEEAKKEKEERMAKEEEIRKKEEELKKICEEVGREKGAKEAMQAENAALMTKMEGMKKELEEIKRPPKVTKITSFAELSPHFSNTSNFTLSGNTIHCSGNRSTHHSFVLCRVMTNVCLLFFFSFQFVFSFLQGLHILFVVVVTFHSLYEFHLWFVTFPIRFL